MIVRANAFAYRVETDKGASVVDISVMRKEVRQKAWATTRKLDELDFTDNPYAQGGIKFGFDPKMGKPKLSKGHKSTSDINSHGVSSPQDRSGFRGGSSRNRGGYRGRNLGPNNYVDHYFDDRRHGCQNFGNDDNRSWGPKRSDSYNNNKFYNTASNQHDDRSPNAFRSNMGNQRASGLRSQSAKKETKEGKEM
ncbi:hypothetical protein PGTUg99_016647 [Puccinia graminis f. sp. tritici]|nr:hypothetical protein PGTUg99_016647 [Puccinia graminis f. sp. tritici]